MILDNIEHSFLQRRNIYISGVGGTGKSHLIKQIYNKYKSDKTYLCSTTGISAYNIGGRTIHSWAGILMPNSDDPEQIINSCLQKIKKNYRIKKRWINTSVLFIDEISMLGGSYLHLLNTMGQIIRSNSLPFGGIQIVCTGDMLQLPPVKDVYPFEVDSWKQLNFHTFNLNTCHRFDDTNYIELLKRARVGKLNKQDIATLQSRMNLPIGEIKPTVILSTNSEVDRVNKTKLSELPEELIIFCCTDKIYDLQMNLLKEHIPKDITDSMNCEEQFYAKIGAQVMLTINKDVEGGLVNGSRGVIKGIEKDDVGTYIVVKFMNGLSEKIGIHAFTIEDDDKIYIREAYPLKVCFAITFHKVQGLTLDCIYIDIGSNIFCAGQAYVGLSRCKNLNSLYLRSFQPHKIYPDKTALKFDQTLSDIEI
jgi:ATP-dependent DNA helicase PIF1